ncbi:MAG TPA: SAM-dependent methyltransferase [Methylococcus sp.]|nr:SAM-dependent methyltransferase [Methylococcus sp.]
MRDGIATAIGALSATALAYEVLLTRLFAMIQWHHLAYMVISLALLGYGASGTFLALIGNWLGRHFAGFFVSNALAFAASTVAGFWLAGRIPFNPLELGWDPGQFPKLLATYLLLAIPFFCVANCLGAAFLHRCDQIHRLYAFDLIGAGVGACGVILLLFLLHPAQVLLFLGTTGFLASLLAAFATSWRAPGVLSIAAVGIGTLLVLPEPGAILSWSQYKDLIQMSRVAGAERVVERSGPLGFITVLRNRQVPFRHAPGLSLTARSLPPEQLGLFVDGNLAGAITRFDGRLESLAYLDALPSALPYHLRRADQVLVLGADGGAEVLQALFHHASHVDAIELDPNLVRLLRRDFREFSGSLFDRPEVRVHVGDARGFVVRSRERYDLIQLSLVDASGSAGLGTLNESYLYTTEAFEQYLRHLVPDGLLAVTRWVQLPPRDGLKVFATAIAALRRMGMASPGERLALIRGWNTSTLVVKNGVFSDPEIAALRDFCQERAFDTAWFPGVSAAEANRYNFLSPDPWYEGAAALAGSGAGEFLARYKFNLRPATDDRPFFFHFFKWRMLPEFWSLPAGSGLSQLEWGYLIAVATLVQALLAGVVLIVLPLHLGRRLMQTFPGLPPSGAAASPSAPGGGVRTTGDGPSRPSDFQALAPAGEKVGSREGDPSSLPANGSRTRWKTFAYFTAIGLAFLFIEIAFIQKLVLFLHHPLYAVAVALSAFLVWAGLGSNYSRRLDSRHSGLPFAAIACLALAELLVFPHFVAVAVSWSEPIRIFCALGWIAPLAFFMGMPFPLGLARTAAETPELLPWVWGINGCASVVSAVLASLLAVEVGFSGVVLAGAGLYGLAAFLRPGLLGSNRISLRRPQPPNS